MDKKCTACDVKKPFDEFRNGYAIYSWCRSCRSVLVRRKKPRHIAADVDAFRARAVARIDQQTPVKRLKPETVRLIRSMYTKGKPVIQIARGMNLKRTVVSKIVNNKSYREVS